jgi:hypothetical protein
MSHFKESVVDFGTVNRNSSKIIIFRALPTIPNIIDIQVACGCTKCKWYPESRELKVTYKAGEIPKQILGNQDVRKEVTVVYNDRTSETLILKGLKVR